MPAEFFSHQVSIPRGVDHVWAQLNEVDTWAHIGPVDNVSDPVYDDDGLASFRWSTSVGPRSFQGTAVRDEFTEMERMSFILDAGEMTGSISTELDADDEATELVVTLGIEAKGLLSSMFFGVIRDAVGRGLPAQVDEFAHRIGA
ncbi:MAG: SRPBCC family protein [Acidimicrobiia bacterium]|nr:SRPBCC family protein [Acidimicrobiia bacterium]MBT8214695.1 SRPBCC family protein [Acidimicrobiia bacterium]NNC75869.1 SRPBCC family protein [Acidimicrobiia bacterium]NNK91526.1 SRPBCC family protein [Acidimicrobiia bacterium]